MPDASFAGQQDAILSDYPEFAKFLVERGINSVSLNPDTVLQTTQTIRETEQELGDKNAGNNGNGIKAKA